MHGIQTATSSSHGEKSNSNNNMVINEKGALHYSFLLNMAWNHAPVGDSLLLFHSLPPFNSLSPLSPFPYYYYYYLIHTPQPLPLIDSLRRFPTASVQIHPKVRPSLDVPNPFPAFPISFVKNIISNFRFPFLALPSTRLDPPCPFWNPPDTRIGHCAISPYIATRERALSLPSPPFQGSPDVQIAYPSTTISIPSIWSG